MRALMLFPSARACLASQRAATLAVFLRRRVCKVLAKLGFEELRGFAVDLRHARSHLRCVPSGSLHVVDQMRVVHHRHLFPLGSRQVLWEGARTNTAGQVREQRAFEVRGWLETLLRERTAVRIAAKPAGSSYALPYIRRHTDCSPRSS